MDGDETPDEEYSLEPMFTPYYAWFDKIMSCSPHPFAQITVICRFDASRDTALIMGDEDRDWLIKALQHRPGRRSPDQA